MESYCCFQSHGDITGEKKTRQKGKTRQLERMEHENKNNFFFSLFDDIFSAQKHGIVFQGELR
jgi:hypothetical protein